MLGGRTLCAVVIALSSGCALAPSAPDSMPPEIRAAYEDIGGGISNSGRYTKGVAVGTGKERFMFEVVVYKEEWGASVHMPEESRCTTVLETNKGLEGWQSGNGSYRTPLDTHMARQLYRDRLTRLRKALEDGSTEIIHDEPLLQGHILGYSFKLRKPFR